jgi:hypothetical protein
MAYRSLRKFKQQQREYEFLQDRAADAYFDDEPQLTEAERAAEWDDKHWERIDAEARGVGVGEWHATPR